MQTQAQSRQNELKSKFEAGQKMLAQVEAHRATVQNTLLRLSAAIQVLEEELGRVDDVCGKSEVFGGGGGSQGIEKAIARYSFFTAEVYSEADCYFYGIYVRNRKCFSVQMTLSLG